MSENQQFDQLLETLKQKNATRTLNIWIPSLKKGVPFKHLTLEQQKTLIKSSVRENLLKLDFSRNIYNILKENNTDNTVDIDKLTIVDLISIGLAYRAADISNEYGFYVGDEFFLVDLNKICERTRTTDYKNMFQPDTIIADGYHVTVQIPTIKVDKQMNDHLFEKYQDVPDDPELLRDVLADVYIHEAAKYITNIDIVEPGDNPDVEPLQIDLTNTTAAQRLDVINQIPLTVLNRLVDVSDKVQEIESLLLDVDLNGETATIQLNSAFFT